MSAWMPPLSTLRDPRRPIRPAAEFWREFAERAACVQRDAPARRPALIWPTAGALAAAAVVLLAVWLLPASPARAGVVIESLAVPARHDAVLVLRDTESSGVIVVIDGLDAPEERP